jgi:hypothetical protein
MELLPKIQLFSSKSAFEGINGEINLGKDKESCESYK